jgi:hypothetical protein
MANTQRKEEEKSTERSGQQKRAEQAGHAVGETVSNVASGAVSTADRTAEYVGGGMRTAANTVRENTPHEGMLGAASSAVANTLDSAGQYLEREGISGAAHDLYTIIQRYPVTAMLIGVAAGYLIACASSSRA